MHKSIIIHAGIVPSFPQNPPLHPHGTPSERISIYPSLDQGIEVKEYKEFLIVRSFWVMISRHDDMGPKYGWGFWRRSFDGVLKSGGISPWPQYLGQELHQFGGALIVDSTKCTGCRGSTAIEKARWSPSNSYRRREAHARSQPLRATSWRLINLIWYRSTDSVFHRRDVFRNNRCPGERRGWRYGASRTAGLFRRSTDEVRLAPDASVAAAITPKRLGFLQVICRGRVHQGFPK